MTSESQDAPGTQDDSKGGDAKQALKNDWEQTKHDLGSDKAADLDQDAGDTLKQAAGKEPADGTRN